MTMYRKKPIVIEAVQWLGKYRPEPALPTWFLEAEEDGTIRLFGDDLVITTLEGEMTASLNDWIIQGVKGELYPCKPDIFEATYEPVEPETVPARRDDADSKQLALEERFEKEKAASEKRQATS